MLTQDGLDIVQYLKDNLKISINSSCGQGGVMVRLYLEGVKIAESETRINT